MRFPARPRHIRARGALLAAIVAPLACAPAPAPQTDGASAAAPPATARLACEPAPEGITLADGFCAVTVVDSIGRARHIDVAPNGDIFVAIASTRTVPGGIMAMRDTDGDGRVDVRERFGDRGGTGIIRRGEHLYFATDDAVLRYPLPSGSLRPSGPPDTIVMSLPADRSHAAKSIAIGADGALYVNIGSPSNACQVRDRQRGAPAADPCAELETRAGIWRFDAGRLRQTQADGSRFATGIRNAVGITIQPSTGTLYAMQHGRDNLHSLYPEMYTEQQSAEQPSEELLRVNAGDDFGWPYCYHDNSLGRKVLAPEYGGDSRTEGRCASVEEPVVAFPGHWAPNAIVFYTGTHYPARYRGGAFVAFHGSWNRAPLPQAGYKVAFVPFRNGSATGSWEVFADGFAGETVSPQGARYRPTGLAVAPDGSLLIVDGQRGRIWRVYHRG